MANAGKKTILTSALDDPETIAWLGRRRKAEAQLRADAARGRVTLEAARSGHEEVHGTAAEKALLYCQYQAEIDRLHRLYPSYSHSRLAGLAREAFKSRVNAGRPVSARTIRDHTRDPRKKT